MEDQRIGIRQFKDSYFWYFGMILVFTVCMNYDLRKSYIYWYGSILIYMFSYFIYSGFKVKNNFSPYFRWISAFILLSSSSLIWCISSSTAMDVIKNLIILTAILYFVQMYIETRENLISVLICYFIAVFLDTIYIIINIDLSQIGSVMLGTGLLEGWNGNGIGFMTASGAILGVFLFSEIQGRLYKLPIIAVSSLLVYVTAYTGSRTAFLMMVLGVLLFVFFKRPSKIIRNAVITLIVLCLAFYLIMNVENLYEIIGIRFEGLFALFSGKGKVDSSSLVRANFITNGVEWFKEKPILGYGINNYKNLNVGATGRFTYAHNNFIEIAVDLGLVGLIMYYSIFISIIIKMLKNLKNDLVYAFLLSSLLVVLLCHYGSIWYYELYQNLLLLICTISVSWQITSNDVN